MSTNASQIINALVEAELISEQCEEHRYCPKGIVVTLSHELGSGGRAIARNLAERLGVEYYDKEILNAIVEALPEDKAALERLDQQVKMAWYDVLHEIVTGRSRLDQYRHHLIQVILAIGRKSGVIVGRGANFILAKHKAFRVNIIGSADICAQRLLKQERIGLDPADICAQRLLKQERIGLDTPLGIDEAKRRVLQAHEERATFIKQLFGQEINALGAHDVVINTDHIPVERAPDVILYAMEQAGFDVSKARAIERSKLAAIA